MDLLKERVGKFHLWERVGEGREKAGIVEYSGLSPGHVGPLKSFGVKEGFAPKLILHRLGGSCRCHVNSEIACPFIQF